MEEEPEAEAQADFPEPVENFKETEAGNMKRFTVYLVSLMLAISLTACGKDVLVEEQAEQPEQEEHAGAVSDNEEMYLWYKNGIIKLQHVYGSGGENYGGDDMTP